MTDRRFPEFIYKITHIHPIDSWPKYRSCMEYSDKLILPYSILLSIRRTHTPLPPLFQISLIKDRQVPLITGVFHFSSEEQHAYFPNWILKKLNSGRHKKEEITLELLPVNKNNLYPYPALKRVELYMESASDIESCKKALAAYSVISKGDWMKIMIEESVHKIYILAIYPKNKCIIKDFHFELCIKTFIPKVLIKQDMINIKKKEQRVMSLDRTKARFYEVLRSRGFEQTPVSTPLKFCHTRLNNSENQYNLRYTAYNWNNNIPPINRKEVSTQLTDNLDILPWDEEEKNERKEFCSQTPPMPEISNFGMPHKKFLNFMKLTSLKNNIT